MVPPSAERHLPMPMQRSVARAKPSPASVRKVMRVASVTGL